MRCETDSTFHCWLCRRRKQPEAKECEQPLEVGKGKETELPLEPPERNTTLTIP